MIDRDVLIDELRQARADLLAVIAGAENKRLRVRPADDEWSVIEVLAHLADVDRHWLAQALAIRDDPAHLFVHFDDTRWKHEHPDLRGAPLVDIAGKLEAAHRVVLDTLAALSPEELAREGRHPRGIAYRVADVFGRYVVHDRAHTEQIAAILARVGSEGRG